MTAIPPDRTEGEAGHIDDHHAVNAVLTEHAADIATRALDADLVSGLAAKLTTPGAWTAYTCTLTASGSNPTLGAGGYVTAFFSQVGKTVFMRGVVSFGTGSTAGSGYYFIDFPVAAVAYSNAQPIGSFLVLDTSAGKRWLGQFIYTTPTVSAMQFQTDASGTDLVQHGTPFAWTDGDFILFSSVYEAA